MIKYRHCRLTLKLNLTVRIRTFLQNSQYIFRVLTFTHINKHIMYACSPLAVACTETKIIEYEAWMCRAKADVVNYTLIMF